MCISELLEDTVAFYKDRFDRSGISSTLTVENDLCISINRGKITQVIDNLILNSEYWLGERSRKSQSKGGKIFMEVRAPYLTIWDNGPGVSPSVEESLFDPFVTMKDRGSGRGLGLFIVQQLLNSEGCSAMLLPERNTEGRRFQFRLDLGGAIDSEAGSASVKP